MQPKISSSLLAVVSAVFFFGCATTESARYEADDFIPQLEAEGLVLMSSGVANLDVFSVNGQQYQVGAGGTLQLYEYNNENRAALEASRVDAGIMSDAQIFRSGNVVAVYLGRDTGVESAIASVFGAPLF